jgi:tetratricopeptide (TPR) repeat protein
VSRGRALARLALAVLLLVSACAAPGEPAPDRAASTADRPRETLDPLREAKRARKVFGKGGPGAPAACAEGARWLLAAGDPRAARALLDEGLAVAPGHHDLLELRGNVLELEGFRRAAEACYTEILAADPGRTSARLARGRLRLELGLASAAREDLERCIAEGEDSGRAWLAHAQALAATGDGRRAFDAFARAFERVGADGPCLLAAADLLVDGRVRPRRPRDEEQALSWLRRAKQLLPDSSEPGLALARLHAQRDELEAATAALEQVLEREPDHLQALTRLAELCEQRGDVYGAVAAARRALELERDPTRRARLESLCGAALALDSRP